MKAKLIIAAMLACLAGSVMAETSDKVTAKVSGTTLNIGLTNETTYCAFQMDITLPEGISASSVEAVSTRLSQEGSGTEVGDTKFIVASNTLDGNVLRVIAYNLNNSEITGATGDILNITLSDAVADPTSITVSNILFVNKESLAGVDLGTATGENGTLLGDVNNNGVVNINDLNCLVEMLSKGVDDPSCAGYNKTAADLNQSGDINLNDLVILVSKL